MTHTQRIRVKPERNHDYLYDKTYTLSDDRDHARQMFRTQTNVNRVKQVPVFPKMFSVLKHHPRIKLELENADPVPPFINRQWRGYAEQRREALIRHTTFNYAPHIHIPEQNHEASHARSFHRFKYFKRPIIPFLQQVAPEVLLQKSAVDPLAPPDKLQERAATPLTRTVQQQTDYRESEAQTDPYSPEYVVRPGSAPEVLTLATLSYKHGLPAGLAEVEMIERARAKRAWEKTLPPLHDMTQLGKRKRMMEAIEAQEWSYREQEIEQLQTARLEVLQRLLSEREAKQQEINEKRLDKLWTAKQKEKEKRAMRNRRDHITMLRKILKARASFGENREEEQTKDMKFIKGYGEFGSEKHAPLCRVGVFLDRGSEQYVVKSKYLDSYEGLLDLENSLPNYVLNPQYTVPVKKKNTGFVKKSDLLHKHLDDIYADIQRQKALANKPDKGLKFMVKLEKPKPRPSTPSVANPSRQGEEVEIAAITLQKVIRGRAVQNMMYEGKENRRELIAELRGTHALQKAQQKVKRDEKQEVIELQRQRRLYEQKQAFVDEALSQIEGEPIGDLLDYLSKELVRLQEERVIHAFCMLAERRRRYREAEEAGRRQTEERRRREEDEIFKQLIKIHQQTVDTYLEDVIMQSVSDTAEEQARVEVQAYADKINDIAYDLEHKKTKLESEEMVSEMVHSFLLPEVLKIEARKKITDNQRKHLMAAHKIVHKTVEPVVEVVSPRSIYGPDGKPPSPEPREPIHPDDDYTEIEVADPYRPKQVGFMQNPEDVETYLKEKAEREERERLEALRLAEEERIRLEEEAAAKKRAEELALQALADDEQFFDDD